MRIISINQQRDEKLRKKNFRFPYRLEAAFCGCMPIAPNKLVYPEIYPADNLYNTSNQLIKALYNWCKNPSVFQKHRETFFESFSFDRFDSSTLIPSYLEKFKIQ